MSEASQVRQKLLELSELGVIKQKKKFLKEANNETILLLMEQYNQKQLEETNKALSEMLLNGAADLLCQFEVVKEKYKKDLEGDLNSNTLLKKDLEK